ncbi:LacI family transcriptional regulator [Longispora fulva]|uniref:DNA-binding LacI/PurR family transcriptional regulator n=1 Tax=Longispora fulva TaxID=619741 RepID=A0A8J7KIY6_9ACTN|nr:LacI family DNA-binding transcriptional regulator [Longispora fulva]MBG6136354.1 DNA-binding LacI/PurR family transcriptional regulator [Longispora fulva]GIG63523.1 LacI family transcriptional regulator [Longispora fulva]
MAVTRPSESGVVNGDVPAHDLTRPSVTMNDVAAAANVSAQTVSRVLNDHPNVRRGTRERVLTAIQQLGYRPNTAARALVTGRSRTLGVITFDAVGYGPATILQAINIAAQDAGYFVSIVPLRSLDPHAVAEAMERLLGQSIDGLITIAPQEQMERALLGLTHQVPAVALDGSLDPSTPVVTVDEEGGARQATEYLLQLGHKTVLHLAGPADSIAATGRIAGWRAALAAAGVPAPEVLVGDWSTASGYQLGQQIAARSDTTAVFAGNDQMALGMMCALAERGIRVPEDISVVGFDDIPEAAYLIPRLSTVRPDFAETGRRCVKVLVDQLRGNNPATMYTIVPTELVVRRSTAQPPRT